MRDFSNQFLDKERKALFCSWKNDGANVVMEARELHLVAKNMAPCYKKDLDLVFVTIEKSKSHRLLKPTSM